MLAEAEVPRVVALAACLLPIASTNINTEIITG